MHNAIVQSERAWDEDEQSAVIFAIVWGSVHETDPVCGWREVADKFAWSEEQIARLARLRARFTSQSRGEAPSDEQLYLLPAGFQFPR